MKSFWQFIKFGIVGISNTLISEVIYVLVVCLRGSYLWASFLGFVISVLNAYYWNNRYVFQEKPDEEKRIWWKVLMKTYIAYSGGFVANLCLLVLFIDILQIANYMGPVVEWLNGYGITFFDTELLGKLVAEGMSLLITIPMNFLINKYWAFRQKKHPAS